MFKKYHVSLQLWFVKFGLDSDRTRNLLALTCSGQCFVHINAFLLRSIAHLLYIHIGRRIPHQVRIQFNIVHQKKKQHSNENYTHISRVESNCFLFSMFLLFAVRAAAHLTWNKFTYRVWRHYFYSAIGTSSQHGLQSETTNHFNNLHSNRNIVFFMYYKYYCKCTPKY